MKIIVGLGNPGGKYEQTRHNAGFLALDRIIREISNNNQYPITNIQYLQPFKLEKKFEAEIANIKVGSEDIILVKPQTFMNLSGVAVKKLVDFFKINPEKDLIVIYDDVDIPLAKVRIRSDGSSAGHKGSQSIIDELGTDRFMRIRIGIGRPIEPMKVEDYVLQQFSNEELNKLEMVFKRLIEQSMKYLN